MQLRISLNFFDFIILSKIIKVSLFNLLQKRNTACPREIVARDGYPLGLIEYMIERVYQVFCHLNYTNLVFFGICINPKGYPSLTFINPHGFGGTHLSLSINPSFLEGYPSLTFHQPKFFRGVPISQFYEK